MAPPYNYAAVSVSNVVATFCQYEALKHVSFPMQASPRRPPPHPIQVPRLTGGSAGGCTARRDGEHAHPASCSSHLPLSPAGHVG